MELQFEADAVIYKPRPGDGEWKWSSLLEWMNAQTFQPRLRSGRVLRRKGYCWMERIEAGPCKNRAEARRFYERLGGLIAVAYLLRAVDCHRDNLIASGEDPVLSRCGGPLACLARDESEPVRRLVTHGLFPKHKPAQFAVQKQRPGPDNRRISESPSACRGEMSKAFAKPGIASSERRIDARLSLDESVASGPRKGAGSTVRQRSTPRSDKPRFNRPSCASQSSATGY